jgi:hypothetical protein
MNGCRPVSGFSSMVQEMFKAAEGWSASTLRGREGGVD